MMYLSSGLAPLAPAICHITVSRIYNGALSVTENRFVRARFAIKEPS